MSKLQELRKVKGISQSQLAKITNINVRIIQSYEQQERPVDNAGLDKLIPLALALNCKISDLLENDDLKNKALELGI